MNTSPETRYLKVSASAFAPRAHSMECCQNSCWLKASDAKASGKDISPYQEVVTPYLGIGVGHLSTQYKRKEQILAQPDLVFISKNRLKTIKEKGIFGAPDWIIEILSPSSDKIDIKLKRGLYQRFGVREYWIVYPDEEKVEVYLLKKAKYKLKGTFSRDETLEVNVIENLKVNLKEIFL